MISSTNMFYVRHDENNGIATQPGSEIVYDLGDTTGFSSITYRDFSSDYVRYSTTAGIPTTPPLPYIPRGDANQVITRGKYVRMDENCNPVVPQPPLSISGVGTVVAPNGLAVGRPVFVAPPQYEGGTPPIVYEAKAQARAGSDPWEDVTEYQNVAGALISEVSEDLANKEIRINTRIGDRFVSPTVIIGPQDGPIAQKMTADTNGTTTSSGGIPASPGDVLTQTQGTIIGGIGPYTSEYQWKRRPIGSGQQFRTFGAPKSSTYTVQPDDVGYIIRGSTRWTDSFGYRKSVRSIPDIEII